MIYQLVLEQLHQKQELVNLLPSIHSLLHPHQHPISTHQKNDQQVFAQLHKSVVSSLQAEETDKGSLLQNMEGE